MSMIDYDVWEDVPHYVLCERVIQLRAENERLRAAGDKLAQGVLDEHQPFLNDQHINLWWLAANWQEARRER